MPQRNLFTVKKWEFFSQKAELRGWYFCINMFHFWWLIRCTCVLIILWIIMIRRRRFWVLIIIRHFSRFFFCKIYFEWEQKFDDRIIVCFIISVYLLSELPLRKIIPFLFFLQLMTFSSINHQQIFCKNCLEPLCIILRAIYTGPRIIPVQLLKYYACNIPCDN